MTGPPRVRAIFFDAGNTLIRMDFAVIAERLAGHGVRVTAAQVEAAEQRARVRLDATLRSGGSTETPDTGARYLRFLLDEVGVRDEATVAALTEWRRGYDPPVGLWRCREPRAEEALALTRSAGLRAAVISNSNGAIRRILETLGLAGYLDFVIDSSEVGVEKPDPRIFRLGLERMGVAAADALYIGDLYSIDVVGARAAGMHTLLLDPAGCWGARDCGMARDVLEAVRSVVGGQDGSVTKG